MRILYEDETADGFERLAVSVSPDASQRTYLAFSRTRSPEVKTSASEAIVPRTIPPAGTPMRLSLDDLETMRRRLAAHEEEVWRSSLPELVERLLTCDLQNLSLLQPVNDLFKSALEEIVYHLADNVVLDSNRLYVLELILGKSE